MYPNQLRPRRGVEKTILFENWLKNERMIMVYNTHQNRILTGL